MPRRLLTGLVLACIVLGCIALVGAPASPGYDGVRQKKEAVDTKIDRLQGKIDAAKQQEGVLSSQIAVVTGKIHGLEDDVDAASSRLDRLEGVLVLHQRKLDRLNELFRLQTRRLVFLQHQQRAAIARLNRRLVEIYTSDPTEPLAVMLEASSFGDMLDQLEFLDDIGSQDQRIAREVARAKVQMRDTRNATRATRDEVAETTRQVAERTAEQRAIRDRLAWSQRELATARREKNEQLASTQETREEFLQEVEGLLAESASLAAKIRSAQSSSSSSPTTTTFSQPSASGFIWPAHGVLTSPFGWRWGRMHEGIDIAVPSGTSVVAAASGTVIVSGWTGGYGNLVVVDHGNGIATAYGHNSSVTVGIGQSVAQGQLIAYSGNTGHSTGPHVHFEVRLNGSAVDPLGYL